jgi:replicative DNA helicase
VSTYEYPSDAPPVAPPAHTPPHSIEAEQAVLGTLLISERPMYALVIEEGLKPEDFFRPRHQAIFGAMLALYEQSEPIDRLTVVEHLRAKNMLDQAGGEAAIDELSGPVPQAANVRQYARIVREHALMRRLLSTTSEIQLAVTSRQGDARQLIETAERMMLEVAHDDRQKEFRNIGEILDEETTKLHELSLSDTQLTGTPSGYHDLDAITGGFQPGNLIILAARPSMGKCLVGSTLIRDPATGEERRLDELVAAVNHGDEAWVSSLGADLQMHAARVAGAMASGRKPVFRVTTRLGRSVVASASHPVLTMRGWTPVEDLRAGVRLGVPTGLPARALVGVSTGGAIETDRDRTVFGDTPALEVGWDEVVCIEPAGVEETYDLDVPGFRNFVADDIVVHNSAFVTNIAENVAIQTNRAVALFSLEMGESELAQRFLASQAKIKGEELRRGRVAEHRWPKILEASNKLAQSPLFVDDSSDVSMLDIRAKSRRLHQQHGLGLIVIDYLQLLRADARIESRVQQVGEMSRGLKILARELSVPVIALSQLSRAVESRTDKKPMLSDLRECVTGDTNVLLANGGRVPIADLVGTQPDVIALEDGRLVTARADLVWEVGVRRVHEVRLASGRTLRATADHRVRTDDGWTTVGDLASGTRVALARKVPEPEAPVRWPEDHVVLLGQLIGDGSYLKGQPMRYTTASEENSEAVRRAAEHGFGAKVNRHAGRGSWHQLVISGNGTRWKPAGVGAWLKELGIHGQRSKEKRIPAGAFALPDDQMATLLRHLWATDGTMWVGRSGRGKTIARVAYATINPLLARDVAALLLRLGIVARIAAAPKANASTTYHVVVTGADQQRAFLDLVGAFGPRVPQAEQLRAYLSTVTPTTNVDTLPPSAFRRVKRVMAECGISQRQMAELRGTSYGGAAHVSFAPSRALIGGYAEVLGDEELREMATSDLFWDRVVDVVEIGDEPVFDLTVPGPACWLADGIVTHNSGNIEQDADLVMFLYREEYYDKETERQGLADVIIAKHRNGGLGEVELVFANEYPKFLNRAGERHAQG